MSENNSNIQPYSASEPGSDQPKVDRRKNRGGIGKGGRRAGDNATIPKNRSRIWLGLSIGLTVLIMAWTFSMPFRGEKSVFAWESEKDNLTDHFTEEIIQDPDFELSHQEYMDRVMRMEDDLRLQLEEIYHVPENLPDRYQAEQRAKQYEESVRSQMETLKEVIEDSKAGEFDKDDLRSQAIEELQKSLEDDKI